MRSDEQIKELIESAFQPLKCVATLDTSKLKFEIFDVEKLVLLEAEIPIRDLRNDAALGWHIKAARDRLQHKGPKLDPWTFPAAMR